MPATKPSPPLNLSETARLKLREDILQGALLPGSRLAEASVAKRLGVSRVPVREALAALEQEGLVIFSATGRAHVKELSPEDFEELFLLRLNLEPAAGRFAVEHLQNNLEGLEKNIAATRAATSLQEVTRLDLDFHQLIMDGSGQPRMIKIWGSLRSELEFWLTRLHQSHQDQTHITREMTAIGHAELVACIRQGNPVIVERELRKHILGWREWLPLMMRPQPLS